MLKSLSLRWTSEQTATQNAFRTDDGGPDLLNDLLKDLVNLTATLRENHLITTEMYSQIFLDLLLTQTKPSIEPSVHLDLLSMLDSAPCRPLGDGGVVLYRPRSPGGGARDIFCEECSDWHSPMRLRRHLYYSTSRRTWQRYNTTAPPPGGCNKNYTWSAGPSCAHALLSFRLWWLEASFRWRCTTMDFVITLCKLASASASVFVIITRNSKVSSRLGSPWTSWCILNEVPTLVSVIHSVARRCRVFLHVYSMMSITLGPAYNEFGYYEHAAPTTRFFLRKDWLTDWHECQKVLL